MNTFQLRQKIDSQLRELSPERLALVSDFPICRKGYSLRKLPPIKRGKTGKDLLKFAGSWQGDDLQNCLNLVNETRSQTKF